MTSSGLFLKGFSAAGPPHRSQSAGQIHQPFRVEKWCGKPGHPRLLSLKYCPYAYSNWKDEWALSFARNTVMLMVASDIPGVRRMVSKFPYCSAMPPLRLSEVRFTWRARNFLGLHASLFLPWIHSTAARWPPGIARELEQSIYFLPNTHPYIHQQKCWKQGGFPLTGCIHLTTQRPLHNR